MNNLEAAILVLVKSNCNIQEVLAKHTPKMKVYVPMPDKFDGRVGDCIESWLR
jgi:hypothetical protein